MGIISDDRVVERRPMVRVVNSSRDRERVNCVDEGAPRGRVDVGRQVTVGAEREVDRSVWLTDAVIDVRRADEVCVTVLDRTFRGFVTVTE